MLSEKEQAVVGALPSEGSVPLTEFLESLTESQRGLVWGLKRKGYIKFVTIEGQETTIEKGVNA